MGAHTVHDRGVMPAEEAPDLLVAESCLGIVTKAPPEFMPRSRDRLGARPTGDLLSRDAAASTDIVEDAEEISHVESFEDGWHSNRQGSEGQVVIAFGGTPERQPIPRQRGGEGACVLDHGDGSAERCGAVGRILILHLRIDGGERKDRRVRGRFEDRHGRQLGSDPQLLDREFPAGTSHPRTSAFFFATPRGFAGAEGWKTSK
jgi:hypothetical protein